MNRLKTSASAYLTSAAHQPVDWYPWSEEAFARARELDRPMLLDIGAVWCHWCHVMDGESYEDPGLADFLNQNFVCLKVDRDERPDVDARYQRAVQAFTGQGGWPLTAFLTPSGEAFYGGTYFPPDGKFGRPGFRTVLEQVLRVWREQRAQVSGQVGMIKDLLAQSLDESGDGVVGEGLLAAAVEEMERIFDFSNGGFGTAPKFPHPAAVELLLHRFADRGDSRVREMIETKLLAMAQGGIHDHLGGGFHRYSTDARWVVPHFEKMSYDNSELLRAYLHAASLLDSARFRATAADTARWVAEVLADPAGGYGASQDADVGLDDDGDYFTWTYAEAAEALGPDELEVAAAYYDIGTAGEMHHNPGKNVLFIAASVETIAVRLRRPVEEVARILASAEEKLRLARGRRPAPFIDRTRYTGWNGMMASAMLEAGIALDQPGYTEHALRTLERIRAENTEPDAVSHSPGGVSGLLDDQVAVARASLDAWEVTGEPRWLEWSRAIMERVWRDYWDREKGGLFDSVPAPDKAGLLPLPSKPVQDAPTPSPNGVAGLVLARLYEHTQDENWRDRRDALLRAFGGRAGELGLHGSTYLLAVDWQLNPVTHLVVTGPADDPVSEEMHRRALTTFIPRKVVRRLTGAGDQGPLPPALAAMLEQGSGARGYRCTGNTCRAPAASDLEWRDLLSPGYLEASPSPLP